jgi:hypothetical protein
MTPLDPSVRDATIWSIILELSVTFLEVSFNDCNMLIVQAMASSLEKS